MRLVVRVDAVTGDVVVESTETAAASPRQRDLVLFADGTVPLPVRDCVRQIAEKVAEALGVAPEMLRRGSRTRVVALARFLAWWFVRRRTNLSYPQIGRLFGRHHSTVVAAIRDHGPRFEQGGEYAELAALVEARLDAAPRPVLATALLDHDLGD